jgi:hypothetical protein
MRAISLENLRPATPKKHRNWIVDECFPPKIKNQKKSAEILIIFEILSSPIKIQVLIVKTGNFAEKLQPTNAPKTPENNKIFILKNGR